MEKIDLHLHTNLSDGVFGPEELVIYAKENLCNKIAITDHEITNDYSLLAKKHEIKIISGIEFNSSIRNLHILGYGIKDFDTMNSTMLGLRKVNEEIALIVIEKLEKDGFDISVSKVMDYIKSLNISCDILDKRKIVKYLIYKKYAESVLDAYNSLIGPNQKYYVPNKKITPYEIIGLISMCGGVSVLAHPNTLDMREKEFCQLVVSLQKGGLDGIEVKNGKMTFEEMNLYEIIAKQLKLVRTAGSDFHSPDKQTIGVNVQEDIFENLNSQILLKRCRR